MTFRQDLVKFCDLWCYMEKILWLLKSLLNRTFRKKCLLIGKISNAFSQPLMVAFTRLKAILLFVDVNFYGTLKYSI